MARCWIGCGLQLVWHICKHAYTNWLWSGVVSVKHGVHHGSHGAARCIFLHAQSNRLVYCSVLLYPHHRNRWPEALSDEDSNTNHSPPVRGPSTWMVHACMHKCVLVYEEFISQTYRYVVLKQQHIGMMSLKYSITRNNILPHNVITYIPVCTRGHPHWVLQGAL